MTEEVPKKVPTDPLFCEECHTAVRLERGDDRRLRLRCACGDAVLVDETDEPLPEEWSE